MMLLAIDWLNDIPPVEWAATLAFGSAIFSVLASILVALIVRRGVMEQIRNENNRFETKLQHERDEKKSERELGMKRDVFMAACEGITRGGQFLAKYADFEMNPKDHQSLLSGIAPSLYRTHLVAKDVTLTRLVVMQKFLTTAVPALQGERLTIELRQVDLRRIESDIKQSQEARQQFTLQMEDPKPPLKDNIEMQRSVMQEINRLSMEIKELENRASELQKANFLVQLELGTKAYRASIEYENLGTDLILAMRDELGLPIDATKYATTLGEARKKAVAEMDEYMSKIRDAVTKRAFPAPNVAPKSG